MKKLKTIDEINEKIRNGKAVVFTAEEFKELAKTASPSELVKSVDVVTTATFGPMCSSGAFINVGHTKPGTRMEKMSLNGVPSYGGIAAVDTYLGATEVSPDDPEYGGAHVIEAFVRGDEIRLQAEGKGTDCYPNRTVDTVIDKTTVNEAYLFNPRNAYQNYRAAVNGSEGVIRTYMGILQPRFGNMTFATTGEWSPLLNDPYLRFFGLGTKVWFCGTDGFVAWHGTQFNDQRPRNERGIPTMPAATLALIGDMKTMDPDYIRAAYFSRYGVTLNLGIGAALPVLDEDAAFDLTVRNVDIQTKICDYGDPSNPLIGETNYEELFSGSVLFDGKTIRTSPTSSLYKARSIMTILKERIENGTFFLTQAAAPLGHGNGVRGLDIRSPKNTVVANETFTESNAVRYYSSRCVSCGYCTGLCPSEALSIVLGKKLVFEPEKCIGCGLCAEACPTKSFYAIGGEHVSGTKISSIHEPIPFYGI